MTDTAQPLDDAELDDIRACVAAAQFADSEDIGRLIATLDARDARIAELEATQARAVTLLLQARCCGHTMTIDSPEKRAAMAATKAGT